MTLKKLFFFCLLLTSMIQAESYNLAICTMFFNESKWLKEWIEYHRLIGVDHFYLYDNGSCDDSLEVLKPYVDSGLVEVIYWNNIPEHYDIRGENPHSHIVPYQLSAFNHCLKRVGGHCKWLAIMDVDEFIFPQQGIDSFQALLDREYKTSTGTIIINWCLFGTSNFWKIPKDGLITELLCHRTHNNYSVNGMMKSIHKVGAISDCFVHLGVLKKGFKSLTLSPDFVRINHYQLHDLYTFFTRRLGMPVTSIEDFKEKYPEDFFQGIMKMNDEFNRVEDHSMMQYVPLLKEAMQIEEERLQGS